MEGESRRAALACLLLSLLTAAITARAADDRIYDIVVSGPYPKNIDFAADIRATLNYLACDPILEEVLSAALLEIRHTDGPTRIHVRPRERSAIIDFNPRRGIRTAHDRIQSPALVFAHELGHVYRVLRGDHEVRNGRFTPEEERIVIDNVEKRIARCVGEPVRHGYSGTPVTVNSVTLGRSAPSSAASPRIVLREAVRPEHDRISSARAPEKKSRLAAALS